VISNLIIVRHLRSDFVSVSERQSSHLKLAGAIGVCPFVSSPVASVPRLASIKISQAEQRTNAANNRHAGEERN
jgi:hypothetical protein